MRSTAAVFRNELSARRQVLLLAGLVALLIFLIPLLPGLEIQHPDEVREAGALVCLIALGYGLALTLGASTFGSDLSEQRLGFFFARPVSGLSVWVGRMGAVWFLVMLSELMVVLAPLIANAGHVGILLGLGWLLVPAFIVGPTVVLLLAHAASVMVRARTPWLILDVVGAAVAALACWLALRPVVLWCSFWAAVAAASVFVAALVGALVLAGAAGVVVGRTDLRRVHAALSLTLWLAVAAGWAAGTSYARWLDGFGPRDLETVDDLNRVDPGGRWAVVTGRGAGRLESSRRFIVSTSDDRFVTLRLRSDWRSWWNQRPVFAGGVAAWFGDAAAGSPRSICWVDLTARRLTPVETTLTVSGPAELDLSPEGGRVALRDEDGLLSVYDFADEALLTMVRLPEGIENPACFFAEEDAVRCYAVLKEGDDRRRFLIHELDVPSGELRLTGEIELERGDARPSLVAFSASLLGLGGCPGESCRVRFFDPRTGVLEREAALPEWAGAAAVLADGRLVARFGRDWEQLKLGIQDPEAGAWTAYDLGDDRWTRVGGEALPGQLVIFKVRRDEGVDWSGQRAELIDLATGAVRPLAGREDNLARYTFSQEAFWRTGTPMKWRSEAWRLFSDGRRGLVRWDPDTDTLTTIAGGAE